MARWRRWRPGTQAALACADRLSARRRRNGPRSCDENPRGLRRSCDLRAGHRRGRRRSGPARGVAGISSSCESPWSPCACGRCWRAEETAPLSHLPSVAGRLQIRPNKPASGDKDNSGENKYVVRGHEFARPSPQHDSGWPAPFGVEISGAHGADVCRPQLVFRRDRRGGRPRRASPDGPRPEEGRPRRRLCEGIPTPISCSGSAACASVSCMCRSTMR